MKNLIQEIIHTNSTTELGGYAQSGYEIVSPSIPGNLNTMDQAKQASAFAQSVGSIAKSMYNGNMDWNDLASLLGNKATDALIGDLLYLKDNYSQFSTDVDITDDQAWALGQRTAGAIYELEQAGFRIKSLSSALKGSAKNIKGQICFTGDTVIPTKDGYKEIKDIKIGDEVYSENPETGEKGYKSVKNVFINETKELIYVFVGKEEIKATPTHPFWVEGKGWVSAGELQVGHNVKLYDGTLADVEKITVEKLDETIKVYNFEVVDWHTYFVSEQNVLVHNVCEDKTAQKAKKLINDKRFDKGDNRK